MKPFDEGAKAFKRGNVVNPYNVDTARHKDWQFGWDRAYFDNLKKVKEAEDARKTRQTEKSSS
jgi:hypothetical protein